MLELYYSQIDCTPSVRQIEICDHVHNHEKSIRCVLNNQKVMYLPSIQSNDDFFLGMINHHFCRRTENIIKKNDAERISLQYG